MNSVPSNEMIPAGQTPLATTRASSPEDRFYQFLTPLGNDIKKTPKEITAGLVKVGAISAANERAIKAVKSDKYVTDEMWVAALPDVPRGELLMSVEEKIRCNAVVNPAVVLAPITADANVLDQLAVPGALKKGTSEAEVVCAVASAIADKSALFSAIDVLLAESDKYFAGLHEQVPPEYWNIDNLRLQHKNAEVLATLGVENQAGRKIMYVSERDRQDFLGRMSKLWTQLISFQGKVHDWVEAKRKAENQVGFAAFTRGRAAPVVYPSSDVLRNAAEAVAEIINQVLLGKGMRSAMVMLQRAEEINKVLADPSVPALVGAKDTEDMLKNKLQISLTNEDKQNQKNVCLYVFNVMCLAPFNPGTEEEATQIEALNQLGSEIDWGIVISEEEARRALGQR